MKPSPNVKTSPAQNANTSNPLNTSGGKKLVQARLPFKTLTEPAAVKLPESSAIESGRKRKYPAVPTVDDGIRAAKCHRKENIQQNDSIVIKEHLLTSETMDSSVEFVMAENNIDKKYDVKPNKNNDNTHQNCDVVKLKEKNQEEEEEDEIGGDNSFSLTNGKDTYPADGNLDSEDIHSPKASPKAKKCLNMSGDGPTNKKTKRSKDNNFMIKLPMSKKSKEATRKSKRIQNLEDSENSLKEIESSDNNDTSAVENSESERELSDHTPVKVKKIESLNDSFVSLSSTTDELNKPQTPIGQKLTPKQLQRKAESEKKAMEKQLAKEERDRKAQEAKEQRQREKDEKELQKKKEKEDKEEQKRREREEKEEQRKRERDEREKKRLAEIEEREKKRQQEIEMKNEERRRKEEQKEEERKKKEEQKEEERRKREEQKEEERKKKEEEKKLKEEAEQSKMRKTSEAFVKFFVPKKTDAKMEVDACDNDSNDTVQKFMSFAVKGNMKLAPVKRRTLTSNERTELDKKLFTNCEKGNLYLANLKNGNHVPGKTGPTWNAEDEESNTSDDEDIYIMDNSNSQVKMIQEKPKKQTYKAKFFKFCENRRPAFHGTWRKTSSVLRSRRPFTKDTKFFDYDIDSDEEWEEDEPGESLHGSDDEKDKESEDEYDIDNEFFVPHGHLSDEEICKEDDVDMDENNTPETQKAKLKIIQMEFDEEHNKKMGKLKPRVIGLIWQNPDKSKPSNCSDGIWNLLKTRAFMMENYSVNLASKKPAEGEYDSDQSGQSDNNKKSTVKRVKITEDAIPDLIKLINGNQNNCDFLIKEFRAFMAKKDEAKWKLREFSNISIRNKIRELAEYTFCPEAGVMQRKMCWYIPVEKRKEYGLTDMTIPFKWNYTLTPRRRPDNNTTEKEKEKENNNGRKRSVGFFDADVIEIESEDSCNLSETVTSETVKQASSKVSNFNIAKFIRVLSEEEKKKQFGSLTLRTSSSSSLEIKDTPASTTPVKTNGSSSKATRTTTVASSSKPQPKEKKRVSLLVSGPVGQNISPKLKDTLVTQYINNAARKRKQSNGQNPNDNNTAGTSGGSSSVNNDVIVLD